MTIVSANDTPEQIADAMRAHGFEPNEPSTQPQVNPADVPLSEVPADEQEIPASADDTTGTDPDPAQPSTEQAPADKKRTSIQKRIDELTAERYTERGKREAAEAEVTRLRAQLAGQPVEAAAAEDVADPPARVDASATLLLGSGGLAHTGRGIVRRELPLGNFTWKGAR